LLHLVGINSFEYMKIHGLTNPKSLINCEITLHFTPLYLFCDNIHKESEVPLSLFLKVWCIFCLFHEAVKVSEIRVSESMWIPNIKSTVKWKIK